MQIGHSLATAVTGLVLMHPLTPASMQIPPSAPAAAYGMDGPLGGANLFFSLSKRTAGITPPVQGRIFAYMGLALYESVVGGMPRHHSIATSFSGIWPRPWKH